MSAGRVAGGQGGAGGAGTPMLGTLGRWATACLALSGLEKTQLLEALNSCLWALPTTP